MNKIIAILVTVTLSCPTLAVSSSTLNTDQILTTTKATKGNCEKLLGTKLNAAVKSNARGRPMVCATLNGSKAKTKNVITQQFRAVPLKTWSEISVGGVNFEYIILDFDAFEPSVFVLLMPTKNVMVLL